MEFLRRYARVIFAVVCVVGAAVWWLWLSMGAKPPLPADLSQVDPLVRDKVIEAASYVRDAPGAPSMWMQLAMLYDANGFRDLALECYQQVIKLSPSDAKAWYLAAQVHQGRGDPAQALEFIRRALELDPKYAPAWVRYATWELDAGRVAEARRHFEEAARLDPANQAARAGLARVHMQEGHPDQAIVILESMLVSQPRDPYALHLLSTAQRQAGRAAPTSDAAVPGEDLQTIYSDPWRDEMRRFVRDYNAVTSAAAAMLASGQTDQAVKLLEEVRAKFPDRPPVANNLAFAYIRAGRVDDGIKMAQEGISAAPEFASLYVTLSMGLAAKGDFTGALEQVEEALKREPRLASGLRQKAELQGRMGRLDQAAETLQLATQLVPDNLELLMMLGQVLTQLGRWPEVKATFAEYARRDAGEADAHVGLALAAIGMNALDDAQQSIDRVAALDPSHKALPNLRQIVTRKRAESEAGKGATDAGQPPTASPESSPAPAPAPEAPAPKAPGPGAPGSGAEGSAG